MRTSTAFLHKRASAQTPSFSAAEAARKHNLSIALREMMDQVNVLGDEGGHAGGHSGCVNALSWARDGQVLVSAGDDFTSRLWRMDAAGDRPEQEYPVTAAGDREVRVFDVGSNFAGSTVSECVDYHVRDAGMSVLRCHRHRVKKIVTEDSPDVFMSVSEDGTVRQHDLRAKHSCRGSDGSCPAPLVKVNHELLSMSMSPLTPYQIVVAGESPYAYLFDRRHSGRVLKEEWGMVPSGHEAVTTCVRRFGRPPKREGENESIRELITSVRMSRSYGHELVVSYSGDAVYLYSTLDSPEDDESLSPKEAATLAPNSKKRRTEKNTEHFPITQAASGANEEPDNGEPDEAESDWEDNGVEMFVDFGRLSRPNPSSFNPGIPIIHPRQRYAGARNIATVKDVNFLGPEDELVVSGSDDGNFFIWDKASGDLQGIYEGDGSVVNVVEGHPHLPVVAVSGIDTTVKLFAPAHKPSTFSKMDNANAIIEANARSGMARIARFDFDTLLAEARAALLVNGNPDDDEGIISNCTNQ